MRKAASEWKHDGSRKTDVGRVQKRQSSTHVFLQSRNASESRSARRRFQVRSDTVGVEEDQVKTCEVYDVKVLGILGSGRRHVQRETSTDRRCCEARGLSDESEAANSAAMKKDELSQDEEILGPEEANQFRSFAVKLSGISLDTSECNTRRREGVQEICELDTAKLERSQDSWAAFETREN